MIHIQEEPPNVFVIHDGEPNEDLEDILSQVRISSYLLISAHISLSSYLSSASLPSSDDDLAPTLSQLPILYDASDGEESEEEDYEPPSQRRRVSQAEYGQMSPDSQRDRRTWLKRLTRRYYSESWHGTAAALLCYALVQSLNKSSNELLWLAIIGLTDQLVHERIEYEKYVGEAQQLQAEVGALNQDGGDETREVAGEEGGPSVSVRQHIASRIRLDSVQELRLSLMRHWTVYEALQVRNLTAISPQSPPIPMASSHLVTRTRRVCAALP